MARYTAGFSKDMCTAFNASDCKYSKLQEWCAKYPNLLNDSEIEIVKVALKRARGSKSASAHRCHMAEKKKKELHLLNQQLNKNKRLRVKVKKLMVTYDNLLDTVLQTISLDKVSELKSICEADDTVDTEILSQCPDNDVTYAEPTVIIGDINQLGGYYCLYDPLLY